MNSYKLFKFFILIFIIIGVSNSITSVELIDQESIEGSSIEQKHPWPMFRHDLKHTARSIYTGPPTPYLAWKYKTNDGIVSSAAIHKDGTIYVGSGFDKFNLNDSHVYAFYPNGTLKWKFDGKHGFFSSPAIGENNTIYCVSNGDFLFSIKDMGTHAELNWKKRLEFYFGLSSPAVGNNGVIHVGSPSFYYFKVNPNGTFNWSYETEWCIISSPAIHDGTVYIGSKDHHLYAFDEDEPELKWKTAFGTFFDGHCVDSSPAVGEDGTIYVGTDTYGAYNQDPLPVKTNFWAVHPNGTVKWVFETEDGVESSPAIAKDGTIYFGSYDGHLYAVQDMGDKAVLKWKFKTNDAIDGSPVIDADGVIYIASRDSYLYALYPDGSLKWKFKAEDGFESSPSIDEKGYLYIGSFDGYFYCIGSGGPDVGVESIDIPETIPPNITLNPEVMVRNYRGYSQAVHVKSEIKRDGSIVYSSTKGVVVDGGRGKQLLFPSFDIDEECGIDYNITFSIIHSDDENPDNDVKSKEITTALNNAPAIPTINGPNNGKIGVTYEYEISTTDQNGDDVFYWVSWYDTDPEASWDGPYESGEIITKNISYQKRGTHMIMVKAKDRYNKESDWASFEVTMSKPKTLVLIDILKEKYFFINKWLQY